MNISSSSQITYNLLLGNIRNGLGLAVNDGIDFLLDFDRVKNWLETNPTKKTKKPLTHSSLRTYYSAIRNAIRDNNKFQHVVDKYATELKKYCDETKQKEDEQTLTEDEKAKWICWSCVEQVFNELKLEYEDNPSLQIYQDFLIVALYYLQEPVRLDYAPMRFVDKAPQDTIENFCEISEDRVRFVLNSYKTSHKYGTLSWEAPKELEKIIREWRKINTTGWFLVKGKTNRFMTTQELGLTIKEIFTRKLGIGATLNILRHSYRTTLHKGEPSLNSLKEIARRMGHSVVMGQRYRRIDAEKI